VAPDWVCEVLSPGAANARRDRMLKPDHYHRAGVAWLWLLDPVARLVEAWRREEPGYLRVGAFQGFQEACIPPFDAVAFDMSAWWVGEPEDDG